MTTETRTKFTAVSPFTGAVLTRKSFHGYTHVAVCIEYAATLAAREIRSAETQEEYAAKYHEVAKHLAAGTTPTNGILLEPASSRSYNEVQAGVKTEWDSVMYERQQNAESIHDWAKYEAGAIESARFHRERAATMLRDGTVREWATFHHSHALAVKQLGNKTNGNPDKTAIVAAEVL